MSSELGKKVATSAGGYSDGSSWGDRGLCWQFVHKVLTDAGAKSYPDYPPPADKRYQAYGTPGDGHIHPGDIMVFIGVTLKQASTTSGGKPAVTTTQFPAHVAIVTRIGKGGVITIVHQNHPIDSMVVSRFQFRQGDKQSGKIVVFVPALKAKK